MNTIIDVNATFNTVGDIKPIYVRLEDGYHELQTYKIYRINQIKNEKYSGINSILYNCSIIQENTEREIKIRYYIDSHKWAEIN